ncbi:MAG: ATP-dependent DNA ligase [Gammaproteobacteria bacterium]
MINMEAPALMLAKELKKENIDNSKIWNISQKVDGCRYNLVIEKDKISLIGRHSDKDSNYRYPEVIEDAKMITTDSKIILDGELCVGTEKGSWILNNFLAIASREHTENNAKIKLLSKMLPAKFYVFDIITPETQEMSLRERLELLQMFLGQFKLTKIKALPSVEGTYSLAEEMMNMVREWGLEGLMLKNPMSKYQNGRSEDWIKWKNFVEAEWQVIGYSSKRRDISALLLTDGNKVNAIISDFWKEEILKHDVELISQSADEEQYKFSHGYNLTARVKYMEGMTKMRFPILLDLRFNDSVHNIQG